MAELTISEKYRRRPWIAVVLSLILPGMGHCYCGRIVRGLVLAFLAGISIPVIMVTLLASHGPIRTIIISAAVFATLVIMLIAVVDSYYLAKHTKINYELKDYNRWYVYLLLILMSTGSSVELSFYVRSRYLQSFRFATQSMHPNIVMGDRILANKVAYDNSYPRIGDIVAFPYPDNRRITYVKRIVAMQGDTVQIKNDELYVNGHKLKREPIPQLILASLRGQIQGKVYYEINGEAKYKIMLTAQTDQQVADFAQITIPKGHCFVLGDNRNHSTDSRHFGPVPLADIRGRIDYIYYPKLIRLRR